MLEIFERIEEDEDIEQTKEPTEYGVDFKTLTLTGEKVTGIEALKVWCFFALKTPRYRYRAYTWQYGSDTEKLIGKNFGRDYTESQIARMVRECLCVHPNISDCTDEKVSFDGDKVNISLKVISDFGNFELNVEGVN